MRRACVCAALLLCCCVAAQAHKPSDSYLALTVLDNRLQGQWDIALRDLDFALDLDRDNDGNLSWDEVRRRHSDIATYAMDRLHLSSARQACSAQVQEQLIDEHSDGAYAVMRFLAWCAAPIDQLTIDYRLFFDLDPQHKGLLRLDSSGQTSTAIFSADSATQVMAVSGSGWVRQFTAYLRAGVWHIWVGFDHILFLLSLLLPAVLTDRGQTWIAGARLRHSCIEVAKIVSAFTLAHSITLSLAALQVVALPSRWTESAIAASVVIAALSNLFPAMLKRRWMAALVFGLVHGFGFASVLSDLGLPRATLGVALLGFNLGVELGQLALVATFLPIAYALRRTAFYRRFVLVGGSSLIILIATTWFIERAFNVRLIPLG